MQVVLDSVLVLRGRMRNPDMTAFAKIGFYNQPQFAAGPNPARLGNVGKTAARHKRAA